MFAGEGEDVKSCSTQRTGQTNSCVNLAGQLITETYPSNRSFTFGYDEAGRLAQVNEGSTIYANGFAYQPHGGLRSETFGNGMVHSLEYNHALQAAEVKLKQSSSGAELQRFNYSYGTANQSDGTIDTTKNNGQIGRIDGYINGAKEWDQRMVYDSLGRLSTAAEYRGDNCAQTRQAHYDYDRFGNRMQYQSNSNVTYTPVQQSDIQPLRNRFLESGGTATTYDAAGNILSEAKFRGMNYQYDANGRQTFAEHTDHTNQQTSLYDCAGQRVQTIGNGVTRKMVYDVFGQNVAEYTGGAGTTLERENIYRGGQLLAIYAVPSGGGNPFSFADDPVVAGSTIVKAIHLTELRTAVNEARARAGLTAATWTDDPVQATLTTIKAVHITELRARLDEARAALGLAGASYTDPNLSPGYTIKAVHVQELRSRTNEALTTGVGGTMVLTYVLSDLQGSTRATMNNDAYGNSGVIARHDYLPFGEEIGANVGLRSGAQGYGASDTNRQRYGLTERDDATGLDHTWWRKYENTAGRWTSPDPIRGSLSDPQSFNSYVYTQNDPVNFVDPSGMEPCYGAWCGSSGGSGWGDGYAGGNGWGNDPRPGRRIISEAERAWDIVLRRYYRGSREGHLRGWDSDFEPQNPGQQPGTLTGTVTDPRQDFKNFLQTMSQDCKDALGKIGVLGRLSTLASTAQIYDVDNLQNARASTYVDGLARGRETLGQWFDRSTPSGGANTAVRVPRSGIYIRGGESAFAGRDYFKLHEMTHLAYPRGTDLDASLGRRLGLTKGSNETWSDAVSRFFNSQCTKKTP